MFGKLVFVSLMNKCSNMKTKDIILQKTFDLLLQKGYGGVSVTDIQEITGMARGLLYHYFGNQEYLFEECIEKFFDVWFRWEKEELKMKSVPELIVCIAERYHRMIQETADVLGTEVSFVQVKVLFLEGIRHSERFAGVYRKWSGEHFAIWKTSLLNSFSRGELRPGLNLESVARQFVYLGEGVVLNVCSESASEKVYELEKTLREFYDIIKR